MRSQDPEADPLGNSSPEASRSQTTTKVTMALRKPQGEAIAGSHIAGEVLRVGA